MQNTNVDLVVSLGRAPFTQEQGQTMVTFRLNWYNVT